MIRSLFYTQGRELRTDIRPDEFPELVKDPKGLLWVDFSGEPPEAAAPILQRFGFHPLAIDDALEETHSPKVDDWDEYLYLVLNYMRISSTRTWETQIDELD